MSNKKDQNRPLYISVNYPEQVRKDVLKAAIHSVELLEKFEYSKELRSLKREKMKVAVELMKDLSYEVSALKKCFPSHLLKKKDEKVIKEAKITKPTVEPLTKPKKRHNIELKRLEDELYEIKNKLSSLDI